MVGEVRKKLINSGYPSVTSQGYCRLFRKSIYRGVK